MTTPNSQRTCLARSALNQGHSHAKSTQENGEGENKGVSAAGTGLRVCAHQVSEAGPGSAFSFVLPFSPSPVGFGKRLSLIEH